MKNLKGRWTMTEEDRPPRLRIVVTDEETGEEIALATGVETLVLLIAPDTLRGQEYRRVLVGDIDRNLELLIDTLKDVLERAGRGTVIDLTRVLSDHLLLAATEGLPLH